ncbi:MAG: hypothetical protein DIU52_004095 [bacterium]|nr:MAG: hypothetical protein DIU52_12765 [bacterium]
MQPIVLLFRPRKPDDAFEVWYVAPRADGTARVVVEREDPASGGRLEIGWPFGAPFTRLSRLVEAEADRVMPAAAHALKRLRELARGKVA